MNYEMAISDSLFGGISTNREHLHLFRSNELF